MNYEALEILTSYYRANLQQLVDVYSLKIPRKNLMQTENSVRLRYERSGVQCGACGLMLLEGARFIMDHLGTCSLLRHRMLGGKTYVSTVALCQNTAYTPLVNSVNATLITPIARPDAEFPWGQYDSRPDQSQELLQKNVRSPQQADQQYGRAPQQAEQQQYAGSRHQSEQQFVRPPQQVEQQFARPPQQAEQQFARPQQQVEQQFVRPPQQVEQQFARPPQQVEQQFARPPQQVEQQFARPSQVTGLQLSRPSQQPEQPYNHSAQQTEQQFSRPSQHTDQQHARPLQQAEQQSEALYPIGSGCFPTFPKWTEDQKQVKWKKSNSH
jgi:hypothetical protein